MLTTIIFLLLLIIAVFVESVFLPYPIVFVTMALFFFFKRDILFFVISLLFAVFSDTLTLTNPPGTALFLSLFLIFLYTFEKVFAVLDARVYVLFAFLAVEAYRFYTGYPFDIFISAISFIILMAIGVFISKRQKTYA